jgi:hypothetical protein
VITEKINEISVTQNKTMVSRLLPKKENIKKKKLAFFKMLLHFLPLFIKAVLKRTVLLILIQVTTANS